MRQLLATYRGEEYRFPLPAGEARLGSAAGNQIVLPIRGVSRWHAVLKACPGGVAIRDLGSKNGLIVEGRKVARAILTPGLRLQLGAAWLEMEEVSTVDLPFASPTGGPACGRPHSPVPTGTVSPIPDQQDRSPQQALLPLAFHLAEVGAGLPGERSDLLARIKATLGAETIFVFERVARERIRIIEHDGEVADSATRLLDAFLDRGRPSAPGQIELKRTGRLLVAGREPWFLGALFANELLARERWRKQFMRLLGQEFFGAVQKLRTVRCSTARQVLALTSWNWARAARLLGVARGTLYKLVPRSRKR